MRPSLRDVRLRGMQPLLTTRSAWLAAGHPGFLTYFYSFKFPLLIGIRFVFYLGRKWHLFLLDFCYFANLLLLAYLWLFNDSPEVLMMIFGVAYVACSPSTRQAALATLPSRVSRVAIALAALHRRWCATMWIASNP